MKNSNLIDDISLIFQQSSSKKTKPTKAESSPESYSFSKSAHDLERGSLKDLNFTLSAPVLPSVTLREMIHLDSTPSEQKAYLHFLSKKEASIRKSMKEAAVSLNLHRVMEHTHHGNSSESFPQMALSSDQGEAPEDVENNRTRLDKQNHKEHVAAATKAAVETLSALPRHVVPPLPGSPRITSQYQPIFPSSSPDPLEVLKTLATSTAEAHLQATEPPSSERINQPESSGDEAFPSSFSPKTKDDLPKLREQYYQQLATEVSQRMERRMASFEKSIIRKDRLNGLAKRYFAAIIIQRAFRSKLQQREHMREVKQANQTIIIE